VGLGVSLLMKREVAGLAYGGAYAEYIVVSTHMLLHKPGHLSWEEAAGIPEVSVLFLFSRSTMECTWLLTSMIDLDHSYPSNVPSRGIHQG